MLEAIISTIGTIPTLVLIALVALLAFYLLSEVCEDALAPALEGFSEDHGVPHDVACSVVVAFGSSAAEIAVNSAAAFNGRQRGLNLSTGALVGSALLAFTVIPAMCTFVAPNGRLHLHFIPLARDLIFFCVALYLVIIFSLDENFDLEESMILCGLFVLYFSAVFGLIQFYGPAAVEKVEDTDIESVPSATGPPDAQYGSISVSSEEGPSGSMRTKKRGMISTILRGTKSLCPPFGSSENQVRRNYYRHIVMSLIYISVLSELCLILAMSVATVSDVSGHFAGLVLVAIATQVDDLTVAMATARKGKGPGSISNALGSQVINLTLGFGLPFALFNISRRYTVPVIRQDTTAFLVFIAVGSFAFCTIIGRLALNRYHALVLFGVYAGIVYGFYSLSQQEAMDVDDDWH